MERQESGAPVFAPDSSPGEGSDRWRKAMEAADTNRLKIDFIETELDVAITFVKIARESVGCSATRGSAVRTGGAEGCVQNLKIYR
jgi:hypothetical protein